MQLGGLLLAGLIMVIAWWSNNQSLAELGSTLLRDQIDPAGSVVLVSDPTATPQPTKAKATATATLPPSPTLTEPAPTETTAPPTATIVPPTSTSVPPTATSPPRRYSNLPTVRLDQLPPEAQTTIELIASDGPFPYDRDGITFQNRERLLPAKPRGYYREFTVITPGINHRGARRIVAGDDGELYYTDDHYASFREVIE